MANKSQDNGTLIIASQLRKARDVLELTPAEVAEQLKVGARELGDWEKGTSAPSLKQLEDLAQLYGREIDYFLGQTPSAPEKIRFRTAPGQNLTRLSREARTVLAEFDELCRCAFELESLLGTKRECRMPRFASSKAPEAAAAEIRQQFDLDNKPIRNLRDLLDGAGVRIFELPVPNNEFSGFSFRHPDYGLCILISANDLAGRRIFTLAHELAHLLYGHESSVCSLAVSRTVSGPPVERRANRFAVELLLPGQALRADFARRNYSREPSARELGGMRSKWGVSLQALGYRLEELGVVDQGYTDSLVEAKPQRFRPPKTPRWERRMGKRFVETCFEAYQQDLISVGKLAHSLRIRVREAMEQARQRNE